MKKILYLSLISSILFAQDDILSKTKQKDLELKKQQIEKSSDVLENSWINPLTITISKNKNRVNSNLGQEDIFSTNIGLNQDIFRSGGIFYAIKYADASRLLGLSKIENEKNIQTITAYSLLLQILKNDKLQNQAKLQLQNAILDIKRKKEQYLAGLIDISFLNNAILEKIANENALLNLEDLKEKLIHEFEKLSDKDYKNITPPNVKIPSKDEYIANNISLLIQQHKIKNKNYLAKLTKSKYLPKIAVNASYTWADTKTNNINGDDGFYNYGISASMPLDIKTFDDIQSSKLEYLIANNELQDMRLIQEKEYKKISNDLKRIDKKISLAKENIKIYESLLTQTKELVDAQIKIQDDYTIMSNSKNIRHLEVEIHEIEKNEKKLEFYKNFINPNYAIGNVK